LIKFLSLGYQLLLACCFQGFQCDTYHMALEFASTNGTITCNGKRVHIKGANWFGLETPDGVLHGLWSVSLDSILGFLSANKFNALRLPVSVDLVEKLKTFKVDSSPAHPNASANPDLMNMTIEAFLDHVFQKCAERGILVMLDMHRQQASDVLPPLWYSAEFSAGYDEGRFIAAWKTLVTRYQSHWNFFACDLKNEPHYDATWGDGGKTDWCAAAGRIGNAILALCPRMLIFVEGIDGTHNNEDSWFGGYLGLAGPDKHPVLLSVPNRLVYSPHVYGPDVFDKEAFKEASFPVNMQDFWRRCVAFLSSKHACKHVYLFGETLPSLLMAAVHCVDITQHSLCMKLDMYMSCVMRRPDHCSSSVSAAVTITFISSDTN
jgi:endoglucanase